MRKKTGLYYTQLLMGIIKKNHCKEPVFNNLYFMESKSFPLIFPKAP